MDELAASVSEAQLAEIERTAVELANLAGAEIVTALGTLLAVRFKGGAGEASDWRNPVSEVDHRVETLIRARLAERFPEHDIIGEEMDERPGRGHDFVWAVDPVDGTTNFVNGFPLFAASIGVLHRGRPIAGALWCAATHALRAGTYHAREGGALHFESERVTRKPNPAVRRGLAGVPFTRPGDAAWENRKTGSAAIECAFAAAGLLRVARFGRPNIWDVAGGLALVRAAGGAIYVEDKDGWVPFERFEPQGAAAGGAPDLRHWRRGLILGEPEAARLMARAPQRKRR